MIQLQKALEQLAEERDKLRAEQCVLRLKQAALDEQIEKGKREIARRRKQLGEAVQTFVQNNGVRVAVDQRDRERWACQLMFDSHFVKHMFAWGSEAGISELSEIIVRHLAPEMAQAILGYNRTRRIVDVRGPMAYMVDEG